MQTATCRHGNKAQQRRSEQHVNEDGCDGETPTHTGALQLLQQAWDLLWVEQDAKNYMGGSSIPRAGQQLEQVQDSWNWQRLSNDGSNVNTLGLHAGLAMQLLWSKLQHGFP